MLLGVVCLMAAVQESAASTPPPVQDAAAQPAAAPTTPETKSFLDGSIWERLSFDAAGRLRGESTFDQPSGEDRHRGRLRLRLGAKYRVTETVTAGARLTTVSDGSDANNPYWDFGDGAEGFSAADIGIDRLYLDWKATEDLKLTGGKFGHVFRPPPVYGEFVWDDDVQPAGAALVWNALTGDTVQGDLRAAQYMAVEVANDEEDPSMWGVQGNLTVKTGGSTELQLSSSYSDWYDLDAGAGTLGNQGNTDVTGRFDIWDSHLAFVWSGDRRIEQVTTFVQYVNNVQETTSEDEGWACGAKVGRSSQKGDLSFFAVLYDLDANCLFSPVAQDDTPISGTGIGTGMDGILGGTQYYIADNFSIRVWAITSDADAADDPYRVRIDIDFKVL